jgi:cation/acetate symporter
MFGTAGLPHVIVRFFTVPNVGAARQSAGYALIFIALLYTTAPAVSAFARMNLIDSIQDQPYSSSPSWFKNWEEIGLIAWKDKNEDGKIRYSSGNALEGVKPNYLDEKGSYGERLVENNPNQSNENEVYIDRDIIVLANPEIAQLPGWVIALVAAGGLAAALSTAAGLLLVISSSISHDLLKKTYMPQITEKQELRYARLSAAVAIGIAGIFGIYPPAFVAQVVAFAFGLAAATFFPALFLGIFYKRLNKEGAITGMLGGLLFTASYIIYFKFINPEMNNADSWIMGISPEGIGCVGMILNFIIALIISSITKPPPEAVFKMIDEIRKP